MVFKRKKVNAKPKTSQSGLNKDDFLSQVQRRAYSLYEQRGFSNGNDWNDWFEAERQVKRELKLQ